MIYAFSLPCSFEMVYFGPHAVAPCHLKLSVINQNIQNNSQSCLNIFLFVHDCTLQVQNRNITITA